MPLSRHMINSKHSIFKAIMIKSWDTDGYEILVVCDANKVHFYILWLLLSKPKWWWWCFYCHMTIAWVNRIEIWLFPLHRIYKFALNIPMLVEKKIASDKWSLIMILYIARTGIMERQQSIAIWRMRYCSK